MARFRRKCILPVHLFAGIALLISGCSTGAQVVEHHSPLSVVKLSSARRPDNISGYNFSDFALSSTGKILALSTGSNEIYFLDDSSRSWSSTEPPNALASLKSIVFSNDKDVYVSGYGGYFGYSQDAGTTWNTPSRFTNYNLGKIVFVNDSIAYMEGEIATVDEAGSLSYQVAIFKSMDNGKSWEEIFQSKEAAGPIHALAALDGETFLFLERGDLLNKTIDGGKTWNLTKLPDYYMSLAFSPDRIGWLVGPKGILRSDNAGSTWTADVNSEEGHKCRWISIDINRKGNGIMVSDDGCVSYTSDGRNWHFLEQLPDTPLGIATAGWSEAIFSGSKWTYKVAY